MIDRLKKPSVLWSVVLGADVLILDRLHKFVQVDVMGWRGGETVPVFPFFDYVLVWNYGISWGMLDGTTPLLLLGVMAAAMIALAVWWWKDEALLTRLGIAMVLGGALSNAIDRVVYGAVADFFHFHFFPYIFNLADVAISLGVALLIWDVLRPQPKQESNS